MSTAVVSVEPGDVLDFWFSPSARERWFAKDAAFDADITRRFASVLVQAERGHLESWMSSAESALALVILLDQFPRNIYRDDPRSFLYDMHALAYAKTAIAADYHRRLPTDRRRFLYLPFMHSERIINQDRCVELLAADGDDPEGLDFAHRHRVIINRFGRFPHRNAILGRTSTPEEEAFLKEPRSSF